MTTPSPKPRKRLALKRNPAKSNELPSRSLAIFDFAYSAPELRVDKAIRECDAVNCAWLPPPPAARNTTIVSPIAREIPMMKAATSPEIAAGIVMRIVVVTRFAPSPAEASRRDEGTAAKASSDTDAIRGIVRMPTPIPAAAKVKPGASALMF